MPWFRKSIHLRQKGRISKKDISDPTDFQHCYHAQFDQKAAGFTGLPPQWTTLVDSKELAGRCTPEAVADCTPLMQNTDDRRAEEDVEKAQCCGEGDEQFLDIHLGSRNATQRRSSLGPRHTACTNDSSLAGPHEALVASPKAKRCFSISNDGISRRLYSAVFDQGMSESDTYLSRTRMPSPSESSGYFSSTVSNLYLSRLSSIHQESSSHTTLPSPPHLHRRYHPTNPLQNHKIWSQHQSHLGSQKYSSLQQPTRCSEGPGHMPLTQTSSAMGKFVCLSECSSDAKHCPGSFETRSGGADHSGVNRQCLEPLQDVHYLEPLQDVHYSTNKVMSNEEFRKALELLVNPCDPRDDFTDFVKIGEGSTGIVYTARQISKNRTVAIKKMDIWRQQRKELLFNEVRMVFVDSAQSPCFEKKLHVSDMLLVRKAMIASSLDAAYGSHCAATDLLTTKM